MFLSKRTNSFMSTEGATRQRTLFFHRSTLLFPDFGYTSFWVCVLRSVHKSLRGPTTGTCRFFIVLPPSIQWSWKRIYPTSHLMAPMRDECNCE